MTTVDDPRMPLGFSGLAKLYASRTAHLGDSAAIILAQSALETSWWTSRLWLEGRGAFGMQAARKAKNRRFQTGRPVDLDGVPHAGYLSLADAFKDRERWLVDDAVDRPGLTIWQRFDTRWAPPDPRYPSNEGYSSKIQQIIRENGFERFSTQHAPPRKDLQPTAPYVPAPDPRDKYTPAPRGGMGESMGGLLGKLLVPLIVTVGSSLLPKLFKGLVGKLAGAVGRSEIENPGPGKGPAKEDRAVDLVGGGQLQGFLDQLLRALIQAMVGVFNSEPAGKATLLQVAQATEADGAKMVETLLV